MYRLVPRVGSFVCAFALLAPALVHAKDLCLSLPAGEFAVLRKFAMPKAGSCGSVSGNFSGAFGVLSGSACTRSDGAQLEILYVAQNQYLDSFQTLITLPLPSLTGGTVTNKANFNINGQVTQGASAAYCKGEAVD